MASLQFVIDSLCSKLTVELVYEIIKLQLNRGPYKTNEIIPLIRSKDRSLDFDSAKMIAQAAFEDLLQNGSIRIDDDYIYKAKNK